MIVNVIHHRDASLFAIRWLPPRSSGTQIIKDLIFFQRHPGFCLARWPVSNIWYRSHLRLVHVLRSPDFLQSLSAVWIKSLAVTRVHWIFGFISNLSFLWFHFTPHGGGPKMREPQNIPISIVKCKKWRSWSSPASTPSCDVPRYWQHGQRQKARARGAGGSHRGHRGCQLRQAGEEGDAPGGGALEGDQRRQGEENVFWRIWWLPTDKSPSYHPFLDWDFPT